MIYFVTEEFLKDYTTVLGNVDAQLIMPLVPVLADMRIKQILQTPTFNDLLAKYNAETLAIEEFECVQIIKFALIWRAAADVAITSSFQLTNKGVQTQNGTNSESAENNAIYLITKHYNQKAEFYEECLRNFLNDNYLAFPLYVRDNCGDDSSTSYNQDIHFI